MSNKAWKQLVACFADGRRLCNCEEAYRDDAGICQYGCSANKIYARDGIAERVVKMLDLLTERRILISKQETQVRDYLNTAAQKEAGK